jgi:hypothetical protein
MPAICAALRPKLADAVRAVALLGAGTAAASAAAAPRCFGAAARDAAHPCFNATRGFVPAVEDRDNVGASPCKATDQQPSPVCMFGASAKRARSRIALIGDSHALHWRAALDHVARARRWQGFSLTAPACFYSEATFALVPGLREGCIPWFRAAKRWFGDHPQVNLIFVSSNAPTPVEVAPGQTALDVKIDGYRRAWNELPKTVKHVVVIRDTPVQSDTTFACVKRVAAAGTQRPGPACPTARAEALVEDPAVAAVQAIGSRRFGFVDLSDFFCGATDCYPVIGGVLVHRDRDHMTVLYSQTLGPYLLRRVQTLMRSW